MKLTTFIIASLFSSMILASPVSTQMESLIDSVKDTEERAVNDIEFFLQGYFKTERFTSDSSNCYDSGFISSKVEVLKKLSPDYVFESLAATLSLDEVESLLNSFRDQCK